MTMGHLGPFGPGASGHGVACSLEADNLPVDGERRSVGERTVRGSDAAGREYTESEIRRLRLRDGRTLLLRPPRREDASAMGAFTEALVADGRGMVLTAEEARRSPKEVADSLGEFPGEADNLMRLAVTDDGQIAGCVDITRPARRLIRHNGLLGMGVHPAWQGVGLGRTLIEAALAWAPGAGVTRVELYVLADNARAVALYESVGFRHAYRRRDFLRRLNGERVDDLVMEWYAA